MSVGLCASTCLKAEAHRCERGMDLIHLHVLAPGDNRLPLAGGLAAS